MQILSTESLLKIKQAFKEGKNIIEKPFDVIKDELNLSFVERYKLDETIQLILPESTNTIELSRDKENCILIKKALPYITPADATDERLWVTLCLVNYREYLVQRWGKSKNVNSHITAAGFRERMSRNGIGRLWWTIHIASTLDSNNPERFLDTLLFNSDYRQQLLERTSSANSRVVLKSILEITEEMKKKGKEYNRDKFRSFLKEIGFLGKRTLFPSMDEEKLKELMRPSFEKFYT